MTLIVGVDPASVTGVAVYSTNMEEWYADEMDWQYAANWVDGHATALWDGEEDIVVGFEVPFTNFSNWKNGQSAIKQSVIYGFLWGNLHNLLPHPATYIHMQVSEWRKLAGVPNSKEAAKTTCTAIAEGFGLSTKGPRGGMRHNLGEAVGIALAAGKRYHTERGKNSPQWTRPDKVFLPRL